MSEQTQSEQSYSRIVVITMYEDRDVPKQLAELSSDRIAAGSIGEALDVYAPDPGPGARFIVEYIGRALFIGSRSS